MGPTNPAEEHFKGGLWGWATSTWEKLVSSGGRLFTALHGWDGAAWRKLPIVWGYSDQYVEREKDEGTAGGDITFTFSTVPSGEVWVVTTISLIEQTNAPTKIRAWVAGAAGNITVVDDIAPFGDVYTIWEGQLYLVDGDNLAAKFYGSTAGDNLYAFAGGYKMKVAE